MAVERRRSLACWPESTGVNPGSCFFAPLLRFTLLVSETATRFGSTCNQVLQSLDGGASTLAPTKTVPPRQFLDHREPPKSPASKRVAVWKTVRRGPLVGSHVLPVQDQHAGEFQLSENGIFRSVVFLDASRSEQPRVELLDPPSLLSTSFSQELWARFFRRHFGEWIGVERYSGELIPHAHFEEGDRGPFAPDSWMLVSEPAQCCPGQVVRIRPTRTDPDLNSVLVVRQTRCSVPHVGSRCGCLDLFAFLDDRIDRRPTVRFSEQS
jgi:hypothetical protein